MIRHACLPAVLALSLLFGGCSKSEPPTADTSKPQLPEIAPPGGAAPAQTSNALPIPAAPQVPARGYVLMDFTSGQVLAAMNENERLEPASLTKLMTAYGVFHALADGRIKLDDQVRISAHARDQDGSRMFVEVGSLVRVEDLIQGMIVQSGNDATVALAEHVAGSEPVFVDLMNQYAQKLGMSSTRFDNSPGMPGPQHYTTARDIGVLAAALISKFSAYYKWYSQRDFTWNKIRQPNRNGLLDRDPSVDGLKTGHTESAGYCLVSSANRDGMRLVAVVMGSPSIQAREDASAALLNYGFRFFESRRLYSANDPVVTARVWKGTANEVRLGVLQDVRVAIPRGQSGALNAAADVANPLLAPLSRATSAGTLRLTHGTTTLGTYPLHPLDDVPEAGFFGRMIDDVKLWWAE